VIDYRFSDDEATFNAFLAEYARTLPAARSKGLRDGQHLFLLLTEHRRDVAVKIWGTGMDPFHKTTPLPSILWDTIQTHWENGESPVGSP